MISKILKYTLNTILLFLVVIGLMVAFSLLPLPGNYKVFSVQSGSMEPNLHMGSLIFVKPQADYNVGDIITRRTSNPRFTTTHRIASKETQGSETVFKTKGDANNAPDAENISKDSIVGKEVLTIPFLGYPVGYAKTLPGLVLLIILPAVIIVYDEAQSIAKEISLIRKEKATSKAVIRKQKRAKRYFDVRAGKARVNVQIPINFFKKYVDAVAKKI